MTGPLTFDVDIDPAHVDVGIDVPNIGVDVDTEAVEIPLPGPPVVVVVPVPGQPGPQGLPGEGVPAFGEYLIGVKDGVNLAFETLNPFRPNTTAVYINGLREDVHECYIESPPNIIVFDEPPSSTDKLTIDYILL